MKQITLELPCIDTLNRLQLLTSVTVDAVKPTVRSKSEAQYAAEIQAMLSGQKNIAVTTSEYLDGCFEADVLVCVTAADGPITTAGKVRKINIEIDGPAHLHPSKRRFYQSDKYLREHCGIEVHRIGLKL